MRPEKTTARPVGHGGLTRSLVLVLFVLAAVLAGSVAAQEQDTLFARLDTDIGSILLVFYPELAPHHVDNFVHLSRTGFYDGSKFHRIVPGFVIQGGDPNSKDADPRNDGMGGPTMTDVLNTDELDLVQQVNDMLETKGYEGLDGPANLKAEFSQTVKHSRGTLSMARGQSLDSAGSQFFICVAPTAQLDGKYTIFGQVVTGMDVADIIVNAEKNPSAGRDAPRNPVAINKATIIVGVAGLLPVEKAAWEEMPADLKSAK
ncbi:MAG: peptidylprolyl isomerase [Candidatus Krumholzibacteria bacterium]|nr:peptidylprolyl isomerase [Candidatus Krumholzibacteria bacterium]